MENSSEFEHEAFLSLWLSRVCELVGIDCIEQYLPHRVAMQFGMDQDIPGHVARCNETPEVAWRSYRGEFDDEDNLTIFEVLKSRKKRSSDGNEQSGDGRPLLGTQSQSLSSSTANDGTTRKMELATGPAENIMRSEASMGSDRAMRDKNDREARSPVYNTVSNNNYEGVNDSSGTVEIPGLELEARISKLEKVFSDLKTRTKFKLNLGLPQECNLDV
ncbi:hypothetical protein L1049_000467 [Liquidambar formosana]|uniref:Aminotransferase-like plant mobile domain-containing protein n=1 Tax=Liquidambar formosana TaxID=63359 RepID=A0AAP0NAI2_LIQFO